LWEVSQGASGRGIGFLGVQAEVVGQTQQCFEEGGGFITSFDASERFGEPERTGEKGTFGSGEAIVSEVTMNERTVTELTTHGVDRARETI
jgi:hypothetical protein